MTKNNNGKKLAVGTAVAAVAGFVAGILTAPKSGKETREDIKESTKSAIAETEKTLKRLHSELASLLSEGQDRAKGLKDTAKKDLDKALAMAAKTRDKAKEVISSFHEGDADDKDLDKAIDEVHKAVSHLKLYLKK